MMVLGLKRRRQDGSDVSTSDRIDSNWAGCSSSDGGSDGGSDGSFRSPHCGAADRKSDRRRRAEAFLASKYSRVLAAVVPDGEQRQQNQHQAPHGALAGGVGSKRRRIDHASPKPPSRKAAPAAAPQHVVCVPACRRPCGVGSGDGAWCDVQVEVPHCDWAELTDGLQRCLEGPYHSVVGRPLQAGAGLRVMVAETEAAVREGVTLLNASMQDPVIAIDLEWKPDTSPKLPRSRVALLQLASSSFCLLVRTSVMGWAMPRELREFLSDPAIVTVGYSWDTSDETKCRASFGFGRSDFGRLLDLQEVAKGLGYHGYGLAGMAARVLGLKLDKSKEVCRSNWQARELTAKQLRYAAMDALVTGHLFRGVRLWHGSPSDCGGCQQALGLKLQLPTVAPAATPIAAGNGRGGCKGGAATAALQHKQQQGRGRLPCPVPLCGKTFDSAERWFNHVAAAHGSSSAAKCGECGRVRGSTSGTSAGHMCDADVVGDGWGVGSAGDAADGLWINAAAMS